MADDGDEQAKTTAERDAERAQQDAERVQYDAERVGQDVQRVEHDVERVAQDVGERVVQDTERAQQDADRAQQDVERGQQDDIRSGKDAERSHQDDSRIVYDAAVVELVRTLTRQAEILADQIKGLNTSQSRFNRWAAAVAVVLLGMVAALGYAFYQIDSNTDRIDEIQSRTSSQVLCPLYTLFLSAVADPSAADANRDGKVTQAEQERFNNSVKVIRDGYTVLICKPPLKP